MMNGEEMASELVGKHIDQLYSRLEAIWAWRSKSLIALVGLSIVLLAVVSGVVQAPAEFGGLRVVTSVASRVFVALALIGTAATGAVFNAMDLRSDALVRRLLLLYERGGYDNSELTEWSVSPLSSHHPVLVVLNAIAPSLAGHRSKPGLLYDLIAALVISVAVVLLPAIATVVAGIWLVRAEHVATWSVALSALSACVAVANPIVGILRSRDREGWASTCAQ